MSNPTTDLQAILARREALAAELADIDARLARAHAALTGGTAEPAPRALRGRPSGRPDGSEPAPGTKTAAALAYLRSVPSARQCDVAKAMGTDLWSGAAIVKNLVTRGFVVRVSHGVYAAKERVQ